MNDNLKDRAEANDRLFFVLPGARQSSGASAATMGSKAFGLLRMARLGLPVPPAFVLGTAVCRDFLAAGDQPPADLRDLMAQGLARIEDVSGRRFGDARHPLLVSVRSGAPVSMPGMLETLLNVGLSQHNLPGLLRATGNPRQVHDCFRRLVRDFTEVVHGAAAAPFDEIVARHCAAQDLSSARELDSATLERIGEESLELALAATGQPFPQSSIDQLFQAVQAVLRSWQSEKARQYRAIRHIDASMGTAVTVQAMVFGNAGANSGSGVGFTRDPATGENRLYVDFLLNAQGEDIASGRHRIEDTERLAHRLPQIASQLETIKGTLEHEFHDMQDFEFTVENGRLSLLQTRGGQRAPWAALHIALDMVREGVITQAEAQDHLKGLQLDRIVRTHLVTEPNAAPLAEGTAASAGVAAGSVVFDAKRAPELAKQGLKVILARPDIRTRDIEGIAVADGVVTAVGGRTSHAAVVARQLGKVCLVGCGALRIEPDLRHGVIGETRLSEGDVVTLDGATGRIYAGRLAVACERPERELAEWQRLLGNSP